MECICRDGEIPGGSCERKYQSVAFVCEERKFKFPAIPGLQCWRIEKDVVGIARMGKPVRNCVWRAAMSQAKIYALRGRKRWDEVEYVMRKHEIFSPDEQMRAFNDAKRAMRVFHKTRSQGAAQARDWYRAYVSRLRMAEPEDLLSD